VVAAVKGIPVRANGDPVRLTFVLAGDRTQFANWCMYSGVNPHSQMVKFPVNVWSVRGYSDFDVVITGTYYQRHRQVIHELAYYEALGEVKHVYRQIECADIEPSIVSG
jgi:hypothetical protein